MENAKFRYADDIWKVFRDYDRKDWLTILEPFIYKENSNEGSLIYDDLEDKDPDKVSICGFTRKTLSSDFKCDFNLNDLVLYEDKVYNLYKLPPLDIRTKESFIKTHPMDVCYNGSCVILLDPETNESLMDIYFGDIKRNE